MPTATRTVLIVFVNTVTNRIHFLEGEITREMWFKLCELHCTQLNGDYPPASMKGKATDWFRMTYFRGYFPDAGDVHNVLSKKLCFTEVEVPTAVSQYLLKFWWH